MEDYLHGQDLWHIYPKNFIIYFQYIPLYNQVLPFTLSSTVSNLFPAKFLAWHVQFPLCLCPTLEIMRALPLAPIGMVVMPRSEEISFPWKDQDMWRGSSPLVTMQDTWAKSPSFMRSRPKVSGRRSGGSVTETNYKSISNALCLRMIDTYNQRKMKYDYNSCNT